MATKKGKSVMDWENAAYSSTATVFYRTLNVEGLEARFAGLVPGRFFTNHLKTFIP
jgi:hypothetical protein